jgi:ankyrin repeat protein
MVPGGNRHAQPKRKKKTVASDNASSSKGLSFKLIEAIFQGDIAEVRNCLSQGANVNAKCDYYDTTALHLAAYRKETAIVQLLLENGAEVDAVRSDADLPTALHGAAERSVDAALRLVLGPGTPLDLPGDRSTSLDPEAPPFGSPYAEDDSIRILRLLLEYGANPWTKDKRERTPLDKAIEIMSGDDEYKRQFEPILRIIQEGWPAEYADWWIERS